MDQYPRYSLLDWMFAIKLEFQSADAGIKRRSRSGDSSASSNFHIEFKANPTSDLVVYNI